MVLLESYLKMIFYLLISGIIGWIVGFIIGRIFGSANATELLKEGDHKVRMKELELGGLRAELTAAQERINTTQTELATLTATIKTRDGWITEMESKQKELQDDLDARISELDQLKADTDKEKSELNAQLEKVLADAVKEKDQLKVTMGAEATQREARIDALENARGSAQEAADQYSAQVKERDAELAQLKIRITELEMMMREVKEPTAKVSSASALSPSPKERDDLKEVFGISPELESLLNQKGIYWFRQIAEWSQNDGKLDDALFEDARGHIERENLVASAREAHLKKYGEQL